MPLPITNQQAQHWLNQRPDVEAYLARTLSSSRFSSGLVEALNRKGHLSPKQLKAVRRLKDHVPQQQSLPLNNKPQLVAKGPIDFNRLMGLLEHAMQKGGLKNPKLRIGPLILNIAPSYGRNAGCLYVKHLKEYAGKILPNGQFYGVTNTCQDVESMLVEIATDPLAAAQKHGHDTGECACCGRELTDPDSVAHGIGPVCRKHWGL